MPQSIVPAHGHLRHDVQGAGRSVDLLAKAVHHPAGPRLLVLECQVRKETTLKKLLLLRAVLVHFFYDLPVTTLLLALTAEAVVPERYAFGYLREEELWHGVQVRKLYEEPADEAVKTAPPAALPLCTVMQPGDGDRGALLERVLLRIADLDVSPERRQTLLSWAGTFATLHMPSHQVQLVTKELTRRRPSMLNLRDFPLIRDTLAEGAAKGEAKGRADALLEVLEARGLGADDEVRQRVHACTDVERLSRWFRRALRAATLEEVFA